MDFEQEVINLIGDVLDLGNRTKDFNASTAFGDIPEFDSVSIITLINALEEKFGCTFENSELREDIFRDIGNLTKFVKSKISS